MSEDRATSLKAARDATIDALCKGFADEALTMTELERRLDTARGARTRDELNALLRDLRGPNVPAVKAAETPSSKEAARAGRAPAQRGEKRPAAEGELRTGSHFAVAIMGGTRRAGRWAPPGTMAAVSIMGGVELDFRDAVLQEGVTEINCFTFWGGVEITVPPGVHVDSHGLAILGGFDQDAELETDPGPGAPTIRVNGLALMGGVEIKVAEPGTTPARDW